MRNATRKTSFVSAAILIFASVVPVSGADFKILDGTGGYKLGSKSKQVQIEQLEVVGAALWGPKPNGITDVDWPPKNLSPEDEKRIRVLAKTWVARNLEFICLDIENWPVNGSDETVNETINNFKKVLGWIHEEAPKLKVGIFGRPPLFSFSRSIQPLDSKDYKNWQVDNKRLAPLAKLVDVIFPSLYTNTTVPEEWKAFAIASLKESATYGKPVYAFIWPRYETPVNLKWTLLPQSLWKTELQIVKHHADGVVVWDYGNGEMWDDRPIWWRSFKSFFLKNH